MSGEVYGDGDMVLSTKYDTTPQLPLLFPTHSNIPTQRSESHRIATVLFSGQHALRHSKIGFPTYRVCHSGNPLTPCLFTLHHIAPFGPP